MYNYIEFSADIPKLKVEIDSHSKIAMCQKPN